MTDVIGRGILEISADASSLQADMARAEAIVDRFEQSATGSARNVGQAFVDSGKKTTAATTELDATTKRFIASLERESLQAGRTRAEYLSLRAAKLGVADQATPFIARIKEAERSMELMGVSSRQTAAAMRQLPAQISDVVISLQGGQRPLSVLLQQGSQIRDSFGGIGNAFRGLASVFTPLRLAMLGTAGAVTAVITAYMQAEKESQRFQQTLILTGNAAGTTVDRLQEMSGRISDDIGTYGEAAEALALLADSGVIASSGFEDLGRAAVTANNAIGKSIEETVKEFEQLSRKPTETISKLNDRYRFLTKATYDQIAALEREGKTTEAARVATSAYAETLESRSKQVLDNLGYIEKAWRSVTSATKAAGDAVLSIGRETPISKSIDQTVADIQRLEQQLQRLRSGSGVVSVEGRAVTTGGSRAAAFDAANIAATQAEIKAAEARLTALRESQRLADRAAQRQAEQVRASERAIEQSKALAEFQERYATAAEKADKAVSEWRRRLGDAFTPEMEQMVRAQFAPKTKRDRFSDPTYTEQIQQRVGSLIEDSDVIRAQVYLDTMNALDDLFFDGAISVELYDSAMKKLTGSTSSADEQVSKFIQEQERLAELISATASAELERQRQDMQLLAKAYEEGRISVEQFNEAVYARLGIDATKPLKEMDSFAKTAAQNIQGHLGDGLYEAMNGNFDNIGDSFTQMINRRVAEALAADLARKMFGGLVQGGSGEGWFGTALSWFGGAMGLSPRAIGGPVSAGRAYEVAENGPELLSMQGRQILLMGNQHGVVHPLQGGSQRSLVVNNNFTVNGPTDRRSQTQIAAAAAQGLQRGQRNL